MWSVEITPDSNMNQLCKVCGEPAAGFHFGAFTCEGCKSFFGRTYNNVGGVLECKNGGRCEITKKNRTSCKACRLQKCRMVGMSKSGSRYGRRSNWFKIHCLLSAQNQNGMNGSPEANNNSTNVTNNNPSSVGSSTNGGRMGSKVNDGPDDLGRPGCSPRSLESPSSEASLDDKSSTTVFNTPPGFPMDAKPNEFSPMDLVFTRDFMKLGYDPLRFWPNMLSQQQNLQNLQNLHPLNLYRFMFPNFPAAGAFPGAFPPSHSQLLVPPTGRANGSLHTAEMLSAAAAAAAAKHMTLPLTPTGPSSSTPPSSQQRRSAPLVLPPSSSLTLTPPNGSDEPCYRSSLASPSPSPHPHDDAPLDLSARSVNNNNICNLIRIKGEISSNCDDDDDRDSYRSDSGRTQAIYESA